MKKTRLSILFALMLALLCGIPALTACGGGDEAPPPVKLTAPTVVLAEDGTATWSADKNADKLEISIDGNLSYIESSVTSRALTDGQSFKIRAIGDGTHYTNSDWSNQVTYHKAPEGYTVTWKNGDTVLETDQDVPAGTLPTYGGAEPTKAADAQYTYAFAGWTPEVIPAVADATYTACFTQTLRTYTVTFYSQDGTAILDRVSVSYGGAAVYTKETPTKSAQGGLSYIFAGWVTAPGGDVVADLSGVTGDVSVYAAFRSIAHPVSISIVSCNAEYGTVSHATLTVPHGAAIAVKGNTVTVDGVTVTATASAATAQYTYRFADWSTAATAQEGTVITANFSRTLNRYTVTWKNGDTVLEVDAAVDYGTVPTYNGQLPTKPGDTAELYTFGGWSPAVSAVTGDVTYLAEFVNVTGKHVVTFYDEDGTVVLGVSVVGEGETAVYPNATPTKAPTAALTYTFEKWVTAKNGSEAADLTHITADRAVYACYIAEARHYTVTFYDWNGTLLGTQSVAYGTAATPVADPEREGYRFDGWSGAYSSITADTALTAQYVRQLTVTFVDYDNSIINIQQVDYGCDAVQPADPARRNHAFVGWSTAFTGVVEDLTVKAQYARQYTVTFTDYDGSVLATQTVIGGEAATKPADPTRTGYTFTGWSEDFDAVSADLEITAVYTVNRYTVRFVKPDGSEIGVLDNVVHGSTVTAPTPDALYFDWSVTKGYRFTAWQNFDASQPVLGDLTVTAVYGEEVTEPMIAVESVEVEKGGATRVSVYLCGSFESVYGLCIKLGYDQDLAPDTVTAGSALVGSETMWDRENGRIELSFADGRGIDVSRRLELLTLQFTVDRYTDAGAYLIELLEGTYIIDQALSKVTPITVVGQVTVAE